jgi:hypothetical protein
MSNKILVTLDNQNEVWHVSEIRHLNLLTFTLGGESLGGSKGAGAERVVRGLASRPSPSQLPPPKNRHPRRRPRSPSAGPHNRPRRRPPRSPVHHLSAREVASWPSWASSPTPPRHPAPVRHCKRWTRAPDAGPHPPPPPVLAVVLRDGHLPSFSVTYDQHINKT